MRPFRASQAWRDIGQVKLDDLRIINIASLCHTEQALRPEVGFKRFDFLLGPPSASEVIDSLFVDREKPHGGTVLWRHVANRGAIWQGQRTRTLAEKFNKFTDDFFTPQEFRHAQYKIGRCHAFAQATDQLKTHYIRRQKINWLAEHGSLCLDAATTPRDDTNAIDHGGVAVCADE